MSVPSASVNIQVRFSPEAIALLPTLTEQAILRAIDRTVARLTAAAKSDTTQLPVLTGRLRDSVAVAGSPRTIIMHWSAIDDGYDYAKVQDVGRTNMVGNFYSDHYRALAKRWLVEALRAEIAAIGVVGS